jgi:hypothetical protein
MINAYCVGKEVMPDWLFELMNDNKVVLTIPFRGIGVSSASVQTTKDGIQVAQRGDYIKQYLCGTLTVERVGSVKVNASAFAVHSSLNGI